MQAADFHAQLRSHRSIRSFDSTRDVEPEKLERILQSALRASSSGNMQAYSIIVTRDPEIRRELLPLHFDQTMVTEAPVFLTFCADFRRMRRWLELREAPGNFDNVFSFMIGAIDAILAAQNAALAAEAEGLGICYLGTTLASSLGIARVLGCPPGVVPVVGFPVGYGLEDPAPRDRLPLASLVHSERYQDPSDEGILESYRERETKGWERYMTVPELRERIEASGVRNLAQVYTQLKYTRESHEGYTRDFLEGLREQGFGVGL